MQNWTPLAESLYVAMQYFKQEPIDPSLDTLYNPGYSINSAWDPYDQDGASAYCAKSFVLLFTDGSSTKDYMIPDTFKNYDGDSHEPNTQTPAYAEDGTDFLDDLALYTRTNDLRDDIDGDQNLDFFVVYAFGDDPAAQRLLKDASRNGGFIEKNGNNRPDPATGAVVDAVDYTAPPIDDSWSEWWEDKRTDLNGNALPDTYFEAKDGWQLEQELIHAITKILERANSGTAVSVLATSGEGEGALYQAYFRPKFSTATEEVHWTGYLQSLWVDALGNLREDLGNPGILELDSDPIVTFFYDDSEGETKFERRQVTADYPYGTPDPASMHPLVELSPLWEAGGKLASRSASSRKLFTSVDAGGFIAFTEANKNLLKLHLDLADDLATGEEDFAYMGTSELDRVINLIRYIRGVDSAAELETTTNVRNRTLDGKVWKLGDIVHSTPTPVGRPVDNYDIIYGDETYAAYYKLHKDRETVVYAGANDGMLHAFLAGVFYPGAAITGDGAKFTVDAGKYPGLGSGDEIWAYIPQNLLPHLKWLADTSYIEGNHIYYVDLKPRIFDARIYEGANDAGHPLHTLWTAGMNSDQRDARPNGWSTLLVGGMRLGGGSITVSADWDNNPATDDTRTFASSYFTIDITDPKNPILLWERNYADLGFTTSFPAVLKVDNRVIDTVADPDEVNTLARHWYLLFGSGPTLNDYDGTSSQSGSIYLVDLATGTTNEATNPGKVFTQSTHPVSGSTPLPANGFMGSPVTVDLSVDYSVNVAYIGESHESGGTFDGGVYRLQVPTTLETVNGAPILLYDVDPNTWVLSHMFDAGYAVTAAPAAAVGTVDSGYSLWLYFGTGRNMSIADRTDTSQQYLIGLKDPYYNSLLEPTQRSEILDLEPLSIDSTYDLSTDKLFFDTTDVKVYTDSSTSLGTDFISLKTEQDYGERFACGWYKRLDTGERIINKPSVLGGILLAPSFVPNEDVCGFGGRSSLHALYFETGTAYNQSVVGVENEDVDGETKERVLDKIDLGLGISSSLGIHVGREFGAKGFVQQSTGTIKQIDLKPAFSVQSGFVNWREVR
jgi:type IV pilus assembly protein PilY1